MRARLDLRGKAGLRSPQQRRSLETGRRVIAAAQKLCRRRPFEQITMSEIASESGVSIGSIYARFASKEKLLLALVDVLFRADFDAAVDGVVNPTSGENLESFLGRYFTAVGNAFRKHRSLLRPMTLLARTSNDIELQEYLREANSAIHERLRDAIGAHRDEIEHSEPAAAIDLALLWAGAALRERFLYAEPVSALGGVDDEIYISELTMALSTYLTFGGKKQ